MLNLDEVRVVLSAKSRVLLSVAIVLVVVVVVLAVGLVVIMGISTLQLLQTPNTLKETPTESNTTSFVQSIPLPGVIGVFDHFSVDVGGGRLFAAVLGNNSVAVIDLNSSRVVKGISGLRSPHGPLFIPELNRLLVTNGGDGSVDIYDGGSLKMIKRVKVSTEADNIKYDSRTGLAYVGQGEGSLGIIDVQKGELVGEIPLAGHPEEFELEKSGPRIFVNVPAERAVVVIDRESRSVIAKWRINVSMYIYPMAFDEANHRLFVGTREPNKLVVLDTTTGKIVAIVDISQDADDISYDARTKLLFISCGEGFLNIVRQESVDNYRLIARVPSDNGGRTSIFAPEYNRIYVGIPSADHNPAEIRVYAIK